MHDLPIEGLSHPIDGTHLEWTAVRASGPGGQNVNQVATKVDLRFDLERSDLRDDIKARIRARNGRRLDAQGRIVVVSQSARTQGRNLELAREKLATLIREALPAPKVRRATRPSRSAKRRRLDGKRRNAEKKAGRGRIKLA